jgi:hypothetical protein
VIRVRVCRLTRFRHHPAADLNVASIVLTCHSSVRRVGSKATRNLGTSTLDTLSTRQYRRIQITVMQVTLCESCERTRKVADSMLRTQPQARRGIHRATLERPDHEFAEISGVCFDA